MLKIIALILGTLGVEPNHEILVVETFDGQVFEAGSGTTCLDAFKGAVFPDNWRSLHCEAVYLVR